MSWLFSRALVAEFSAATCWDGAPSAPLSVMPTPHKFWRNDKTMDASQLSRFGLTCAVLTADHGEALLMWFRAGFRVRTSQLLGTVMASTASARASGGKWLESSVKYCLDSSLWRTHRCLWDEALPWSSVTLPAWGMTRSGYVFRHPTAERPISVIDSGLWPTPTVHGNHNQPGASKNAGWGLSSAVKLWTTPSASDSRRGGTITPTMSGTSLAQQVNTPMRWPTPLARDGKSGVFSAAGRAKRNGQTRGKPLNETVGGQLNPMWVEWLMGWPIGWTELKPLEMARFREWQRQHSACFQSRSDAA